MVATHEQQRHGELERDILKTGQYGKLILIEGNRPKEMQAKERREFGLAVLALKFITTPLRFIRADRAGLDLSQLAQQVVINGQLSEQDIARLPGITNPKAREDLSGTLGLISILWNEQRARRIRSGEDAQTIPNDKGLILADYLELIPRQAAGITLVGAADSGLSEGTNDLLRSTTHHNQNPLELGIEGFALLPPEVRQAIFAEMVAIAPTRAGLAKNFLLMLSSNIGQRTKYDAQAAIQAYIHDGTALARTIELRQQIPDFGKIIDTYVPPPRK